MRQFTKTVLVITSVASCSSVATAGRIQWSVGDGGNDHEYEAVLVEGGIEFFDAVQLAEAMGGYLATATSAAENDFIFDNLANDAALWGGDVSAGNFYAGPWLGALRSQDATEPDEGWSWITGETWDYTNWAGGQPSTVDSTQMALHYFNGNAFDPPANLWNDLVVSNTAPGFPVISFIVEYDAVPGPNGVLAFGVLSMFTLRRRH